MLGIVVLGGAVKNVLHRDPKPPRRVLPFAQVANVNVSRDAFSQAEVAIAADPRHPNVLLAASNDSDRGVLLYESNTGGRAWKRDESWPLGGDDSCVDGDPAVAIDSQGRQFFALLGEADCTGHVGVYVARRSRPGAPWIPAAEAIGAAHFSVSDDKPALAVDLSAASPHRGRVYVAWARDTGTSGGYVNSTIVIAHSDDHGRTWSDPSRVSAATQDAVSSAVAVAADGTVYVAWEDPGNQGIWIDRARDGAHFGRDRVVGSYLPLEESCDVLGAQIPAEPDRCVRPNPTAVVDDKARRVYVVYGNIEGNDSQQVFLSGFDKDLRPVIGKPNEGGGVPINPADGMVASDQFWPTSAFDHVNGRLWVCFYDTTGDGTRRSASYSCTASSDGRRWRGPVRVASVASDETAPLADDFQFGDYEGLAVARGVAYPIWTDARELSTSEEEIFTARLTFRDLVRALGRGRR